MAERIVIVGGVAGGASAAAKARRMSEDVEIVMFERGPYMSFANCGLPYYVGGEITRRDALFVTAPETFERWFGVDVRLSTKVTDISPSARKVTFVGPGGKPDTLSYDRLILATGTVPIVPPIQGIDGPNMFFCRTVPDVDAIMKRLDETLPREMEGKREIEGGRLLSGEDTGVCALVIGGGYIGLECAEQLLRRGVKVTVVELMDQLMGPYDREVTRPVQGALERAGATVILNDAVVGVETVGDRSSATLKGGRKIPFDLSILGTGVRPNVELAKNAGLVLGKTGAIAVDERQRTSDPAIFAAGDNCESILLPTGDSVNIPLAGPANKHGRVAGNNAALDLMGAGYADPRRLKMGGVLGTSIVRVCGVVVGGTGLTEKAAKQAGIDIEITYVIGLNHAGYYPDAKLMGIKLMYSPESGRLLGAQAVGRDGVDKRLDVLATAIQGGMTVEDLEQLDLCYAPPFGAAKDIAIMAGFVSSNARRGTSPGISPTLIFDALASDTPPLLIDVRSRREYEKDHLKDAVNIPLSDLRARMGEIPKDRLVVVYCTGGYRSYLAQQILLNLGWKDVRNLYGGYSLASLVQEMDGN
ncbi:MAG: FAD-dependent oxidoreductase [Deltaproteobacteria bacterium]|nr:MAG: FAD-dependent oxidoreductase [Deltaproteobacteria bacterium]